MAKKDNFANFATTHIRKGLCTFLLMRKFMQQYQILSKTRLGLWSGLASKKQRERTGLFAVEGEKSVGDLLGRFDLEALIVENGMEHRVERMALHPEKVYTTNAAGMKKLSSLSTPPEVIALFRLPEKRGEEGWSGVDKSELYLVLDGVQDPGNMGTIIRTAHWFGIRRIFASQDTVDIYNPKTIQATMGSLGKVEVIYTDLKALMLENPEMPRYGLMLEGKNIYRAELESRGFIIMGNEGKGISPELRELISEPLLIPPYDPNNHGESLNVAIATAVTLALFRAR